MLSDLPVEILHSIFELLAAELLTLTTYSLVCRLWAVICRPYLFSDLALYIPITANDNPRTRQFAALLTDAGLLPDIPSIPNCIRTVRVVLASRFKPSASYAQRDITALGLVLEKLKDVSKVVLQFLQSDNQCDPLMEVLHIFISTLGPASEITFVNCNVGDFGMVLRLWGSRKRRIQALVFSQCTTDEKRVSVRADAVDRLEHALKSHKAIRIKRLEVSANTANLRPLVHSLLHPGVLDSSRLTTLRCSWTTVASFMPRVPKTLRNLIIELPYDDGLALAPVPLHVEKARHLASLEFFTYSAFTTEASATICAVVSGLRPSLEKLVVRAGKRDSFEELVPLDRLLGDMARFPALRTVLFSCPHPVQGDMDRSGRVVDLFPVLFSRGLTEGG
ncbi:hypothetical protein C8J56DRAFT_284202 [Mycena floridula]|nr:hypothetical protein C8J56DRAFT_284202 [Mycena floridula]